MNFPFHPELSLYYREICFPTHAYTDRHYKEVTCHLCFCFVSVGIFTMLHSTQHKRERVSSDWKHGGNLLVQLLLFVENIFFFVFCLSSISKVATHTHDPIVKKNRQTVCIKITLFSDAHMCSTHLVQ